MELKINIQFRNQKMWRDSERRSEHVFERMKQRGIGIGQIREAVTKGAKKLNVDKTIIAEYRWFRVVYREFQIDNIRKIYPITVIEADHD